MSKLKDVYQMSKRFHGYCKLCWKFTEERKSGVSVKRYVSGSVKHGNFKVVERPHPSEKTFDDAKKFISELIAESKASDAPPIEELLYFHVPDYDYCLFREKGLESVEVMEMLWDIAEQKLIDQEWYARIFPWDEIGKIMDIPKPHQMATNRFLRKFAVDPFKPSIGDFSGAPLKPSRFYCSDHNPKRSLHSRRRYQNQKKRLTAFQNEISRLLEKPANSGYAIDTEYDYKKLLQTAHENIFPTSNRTRILKLSSEGYRPSEIKTILKLKSIQVVTNALRREKGKKNGAQNTKAPSFRCAKFT